MTVQAQQPLLGNGAPPQLVPAVNPVPGQNNLIPAVPPVAPGFQLGDTVVAEGSDLTFAIVDLQELGLTDDNLQEFKITVDFNGGRRETFTCKSKNLKTAEKMIEVFGRQFEQHSQNDQEYQRFRNSKLGKTVWMDFEKRGDKAHRENHYTCFQENSQGNSLEYAFGATSFGVLNKDILDEIKKIKKYHLTAPDDPVNRNNNDLVLQANLV